MTLLSLPNELLRRIIEETIPEDFENFVFSCKAVYQAGRIFLEEHNTLRRRYRYFRYGGNGDFSDHDTCASSLQLIARIADDPRIASYIVHADFKEDSHFGPDKNDIVTLADYVKHSSDFRALLENSPYLRDTGTDAADVIHYLTTQLLPDGCAKVGCAKAGSTCIDFAGTFLLTLLPNVTQLSLPKEWEQLGRNRLEECWNTSSLLDAIVKRANESSAGLSELTSILPSAAWGYHNRWKLSTFTPLLSIESVRRFCAGSTVAMEDGDTGVAFYEPEYESFGRGIEVVELVATAVDGKELAKFLSRMPQLKTFRLNSETKMHKYNFHFHFNTRATMTAIEDTVGGQLEELSFCNWKISGKIGESRVVSLKKFTKLRKLELDVSLLIAELPASHMFCSALDQVPVLSDLCPPTLESLQLVAPNISTYPCVFSRLLYKRAADVKETLPNLRRIAIRIFSEEANQNRSSRMDADCEKKMWVWAWKADLEALEPPVEVEFVQVNDHALPEFMGNFCNRYEIERRHWW